MTPERFELVHHGSGRAFVAVGATDTELDVTRPSYTDNRRVRRAARLELATPP